MKRYLMESLSKLKYVNNYFSGIATIFTLHRVHPFENHKLAPNENMKVSPEFLEFFIVDLLSDGYEFITLDTLHHILQEEKKETKKILFTLDDGYVDNYTIAYPIFKKYNIPFTIYVTPSFLQKEALLWWYVLEDLILKNKFLLLNNGEKHPCASEHEQIETFFKIRALILSFDQKNLEHHLSALFHNYTLEWVSKCTELAMNWDQIIELSKDPLVTIGGHTQHHYALNKLSEKEIIDEIQHANTLIESKINQKVEHIAYPFGTSGEVGQREFDIVKSLGYKTATTTRRGTIYGAHKDYLECLPRIMLSEKFSIREIGKVRKTRVVTQ